MSAPTLEPPEVRVRGLGADVPRPEVVRFLRRMSQREGGPTQPVETGVEAEVVA